MIRQIFLNDKPLLMFTTKEGAEFELLINVLILTDRDIQKEFNETYNLTAVLTDNLEVYVWGDEDGKTFTLKPLNLI